jgi:hypothetical protein
LKDSHAELLGESQNPILEPEDTNKDTNKENPILESNEITCKLAAMKLPN